MKYIRHTGNILLCLSYEYIIIVAMKNTLVIIIVYYFYILLIVIDSIQLYQFISYLELIMLL